MHKLKISIVFISFFLSAASSASDTVATKNAVLSSACEDLSNSPIQRRIRPSKRSIAQTLSDWDNICSLKHYSIWFAHLYNQGSIRWRRGFFGLTMKHERAIEINLWNHKIQPKNFKKVANLFYSLKGLKKLVLSLNDFKGEVPKIFAQYPSLELLDLRDNPGLVGIREFEVFMKKELPNCQVLFTYTDIVDLLERIKVDPFSIQYASDTLKNNKLMARAAVKRNGLALEFVSKEMRNCFLVVFEAIYQNPSAIEFASDKIKNHNKIKEFMDYHNRSSSHEVSQ